MKRGNKGFTLLELLAVIVIIGILTVVAIPSIGRVIENSRKDTFVDMAKSYANSARTLWTANTLKCEGKSALAVGDGDYYILINTKESAKKVLPVLVDQGGKSSWENRDVNGYVRVHVETVTNNNGKPQKTTTFFVSLSDGTHGLIDDGSMTSDKIKKGNVKMNLSSDDKTKVELTNDTGVLKCSRTNIGTYECTKVAPVTKITGLCIDDSSYAGVEETIDVPVSFADDDWATIAQAVKNGTYEEIYHVGDTKEIDLDELGGYATVRIANTSTRPECNQEDFSQTACGFVVEFVDVIAEHDMNPAGEYKGTAYGWGWNRDGWPASSMREYLNNVIYNALPEELRKIITETKVVSGYGKEDSANFISTDKLYLLEPKEVFGSDVGTAYRTTRQLDFYSELGVTESNYSWAIKQGNGSDYWWWLRAADYDNIGSFYTVRSDGGFNGWYANDMLGVSPAFRIA